MNDTGPLVCLLTDFGITDNYVGVMKAVLLSRVPNARIVDLTHNVPAQNVRMGAFQLLSGFRNFPEETFFICVVDPGVGTDRKIIYAEAGKWKFMAPDNGLLSWVLKEIPPRLIVDISAKVKVDQEMSRTFHGRDIFVPVAARFLNGGKPEQLGTAISTWNTLSFPPLLKSGSTWQAEVLVVDGFGNLVTNIPNDELGSYAEVSKVWMEFGSKPFTVRGLADSYSSVEKGKLLAIPGSAGYIEISLRDGNAARHTSMKEGDKIVISFKL